MEVNQKLRILRVIDKIDEKSKNCKLDPAIFTELDESLCELSQYFHITKAQALFAGIIFSNSCLGRSTDLDDIIKHLDCRSIKILEYFDDFEALFSSGIIIRQSRDYYEFKSILDFKYYVHPKIVKAIQQGNPFPDINQANFSDVLLLLENMESLLDQRYNKCVSTDSMLRSAHRIIEANTDMLLIGEINDLKLQNSDQFIFLYLIWKTISGYNALDLQELAEKVFDETTARVNYIQGISNETNFLVKHELVEVFEGGFLNTAHLQLADRSHSLLKKCGLKAFNLIQKKSGILKPVDIISKSLIYDDHEMRQYYLVKNLLQENNLSLTQKRLIDKGLPKGIAILFHGYPGTGKTESVLQLAKETDRMIMRVDISESKSLWFGESEKRIKKIFTDYNMLLEDSDQTPILFLNEADALISKRSDNNSSNIKQTENAMQNILLEEIENFQGILIATTNLVKNFDTAFERRFLFKVDFRKPSVTVKAKIWKLKMPLLSVKDCELLASRFDFSGGQIDNITRKAEIHEIIHGLAADLKTVKGFCEEETWEAEKIKIGYLKN